MKPQSTMVELLKLTDYAVFIPDNDIEGMSDLYVACTFNN